VAPSFLGVAGGAEEEAEEEEEEEEENEGVCGGRVFYNPKSQSMS
jgi:hypothetical protein